MRVVKPESVPWRKGYARCRPSRFHLVRVRKHDLLMTTPESRPNGEGPGNSRFWAPLIGAVGLVLAFSPTLLSGMRQMQENPGDTRLHNWIVEHSWRWLRGTPLHESLWDPPFFFPAKGTGAYTESMLGAAPPYWILRLAGVAPDTAFQWWMLITLGRHFAVLYVFLREALGQSRLAASVGAFLFAFGSARVVQIGHQHLLPQYFSVLALLSLAAALRATDTSRRAVGLAGFGVAVALQIWSGIYLGWFLCLALAIACIWALVLRSTRASLSVLLFSRWPIVALG